ncbi:MAG: cytidine deaminase [Planctomycetes bacterium]|nr:cytidine deaminase [Planctomycetota bacterium]
MSDLVAAAREVMARAHAPYSGFRVGAALRTRSGRVFTGCNVENAAFGLTFCAERGAVAAAVAAGEREFVEIAIVSSGGEPTSPCGACRQVLAEFAEDLAIVLAGDRETVRTSLRELLPSAFRAGNLAARRVGDYSEGRSPKRSRRRK